MTACNPNENHSNSNHDQTATFEETHIREVRIQYHRTDKAIFAIRSPRNAIDFHT